MSPPEELAHLYSQWGDLTERENAAIGRLAWPELAHYQAAKNRLQPRIIEVSGQIAADDLERQFRGVVDALIELEHRNADRLQKLRAETEDDLGGFDRSARSLRQLHRLYIPPARQNWQSYS